MGKISLRKSTVRGRRRRHVAGRLGRPELGRRPAQEGRDLQHHGAAFPDPELPGLGRGILVVVGIDVGYEKVAVGGPPHVRQQVTDVAQLNLDFRRKLGRGEELDLNEVVEIAEKIGRTPAQVALNWVRQGDAEIVPLVGARVVEQLRDNLGCLEFTLDDAQMKRLNEVSRIELGFPREFLEQRFRPRRRSRQREARA